MRNIILIGLLTALLCGCSYRVADLTIASTKNINLNSQQLTTGKKVIAEDTYPVVIFPLGIPNVKTATDKAIEQSKCAVGLTDVVVTQLNHAFIFGEIGIRVEGNLLIDKSLQGCGQAS